MNASAGFQCESLDTTNIFGITFHGQDVEGLAEDVAALPTLGQGVRLVVTANVDHIVLLSKCLKLREAYQRSWRRTIDGMPVWVYARLRGSSVPGRVTGADLLPRVMARVAPGSHRLFFVVATEEIGRRLADWARAEGFAPDAVQFEVPLFGFENDEDYGRALAQRIRGNATTQLFFGVGCPRSEVWIDQHREHLGDLYALAVGAALGFFVGVQERAPALMRRIGMEWAWRLALEPRRLGPRYMVRSWRFLNTVFVDLAGRKISR